MVLHAAKQNSDKAITNTLCFISHHMFCKLTDVAKRKIAFVAPIAIALTGHKVGDIVAFKMGGETRKLEVVGIKY